MTTLPIYETPCGRFWVRRADKRKGKDMGFEVYETGVTSSRRCAIVGYTGTKGMALAISEADRRATERREAV
jgi:hypothetical protein